MLRGERFHRMIIKSMHCLKSRITLNLANLILHNCIKSSGQKNYIWWHEKFHPGSSSILLWNTTVKTLRVLARKHNWKTWSTTIACTTRKKLGKILPSGNYSTTEHNDPLDIHLVSQEWYHISKGSSIRYRVLSRISCLWNGNGIWTSFHPSDVCWIFQRPFSTTKL